MIDLQDALLNQFAVSETLITHGAQCLGVGVRICRRIPAEGKPYCEECQAKLERAHDVAAGAPPRDITERAVRNGNIQIKYGGKTIFCDGVEEYEALRQHFQGAIVEALDDALETVAAYQEAA